MRYQMTDRTFYTKICPKLAVSVDSFYRSYECRNSFNKVMLTNVKRWRCNQSLSRLAKRYLRHQSCLRMRGSNWMRHKFHDSAQFRSVPTKCKRSDSDPSYKNLSENETFSTSSYYPKQLFLTASSSVSWADFISK